MASPFQPLQISSESCLSQPSFLWLLSGLASRFGRAFDARLALQGLSPPFDLPTIIESLQGLGLQAVVAAQPTQDEWRTIPTPAVAFTRTRVDDSSEADASGVGDESNFELKPVFVLGWADGRLIVAGPQDSAPQALDAADLVGHFLPELLFVSESEAAVGQDSAGVDGAEADTADRPFGFSWFVPELLRHRRLWRDVLIASLCIQLVALATPLFTQVIIDKVIAHHAQSTLLVLGVALVFFMVFTSLMTWLRQYLVLHTGCRIDAVLSEKVMRHLLRLPIGYFEQRPTGTLVARLNGTESLRDFVSGAAVTLVLDFPFLFIFLAVMLMYSWQLTLIVLAVLLLIVIASLIMVPIFRARLDRQFLLGARNQAFLTEYLAGISTVKSLQMEPNVNKRYGGYLAQYLSAGFSTRQVGNTYQVTAGALEQTMTLSILIVGAWYVMQNTGFTVGMLVAFQMFASRLSQPVMRLVGLWQEFQQASVAVKRLADILDMPQEPFTLTPQRTRGGAGRIELREVGFRYSDGHPWLYRNLTLTIATGKLTVLMGPSGCGKSTLAKLLQGFYFPQEGQILIDGRDIRTLAANELRDSFGVVPQETVLFSGTVYDNLLMAQPHANFEEIVAACRAAEIHDVIEALPQGYQTEVGERGTGLSGGQRQRIAIARALLKRPKILIFDEAISNLDQQTAEHFAHTINRLKGKVTMIFITHQVPRGLQVDEIVEMDRHAKIMAQVEGSV